MKGAEAMDINFSDLIEYILEKEDLNYTPIEREGRTYFSCQNPLNDDIHNSFQIFEDGWCVSWNGDIDGKNRIPLKSVAKELGYLNEYIEYILQELNIPVSYLNKYRDMLITKQLQEKYDKREYCKYRKIFNDLFISQSEVLGISEVKKTPKHKFGKSKKKRKQSSMVEVEQTKEEYQQCKKYIEGRGLELIDGLVEPCTLRFASGYRQPSIAIRTDYNHTKYRLVGNDKLRYLSQGRYKKPLFVNETDSNLCLLVEGEFEGLCVKQVNNKHSIACMHNTNTIGDLTKLEKYDTILVLIDANTYNKVKEGVRKQLEVLNRKVVIKPKINGELEKDYNDLLKEKKTKLKQIIEEVLNGCN